MIAFDAKATLSTYPHTALYPHETVASMRSPGPSKLDTRNCRRIENLKHLRMLQYFMHSKIVEALKLKHEPVAILWTDEKPEDALGFKGCGGGCIMVLFAQAAAKGKWAAFDRDNFGCFGGGVGLGFGRQFERFPLGGVGAFKYFLSTGLAGQGREDLVEKACSLGRKETVENFLHGEGYKKSPELVENFLEELPATEVPANYVVFKPLKDLKEGEEAVVVVFVADPDQLSALVVMANYDRRGVDNVFAPMGAGCHQIGIYTFREAQRENPRAVIGLTDLSARKNVQHILGKDVFTFAVPYQRFEEMEENVEESFMKKSTWRSLVESSEK